MANDSKTPVRATPGPAIPGLWSPDEMGRGCPAIACSVYILSLLLPPRGVLPYDFEYSFPVLFELFQSDAGY